MATAATAHQSPAAGDWWPPPPPSPPRLPPAAGARWPPPPPPPTAIRGDWRQMASAATCPAAPRGPVTRDGLRHHRRHRTPPNQIAVWHPRWPPPPPWPAALRWPTKHAHSRIHTPGLSASGGAPMFAASPPPTRNLGIPTHRAPRGQNNTPHRGDAPPTSGARVGGYRGRAAGEATLSVPPGLTSQWGALAGLTPPPRPPGGPAGRRRVTNPRGLPPHMVASYGTT
jgi:hypothetical protein